MNILFLSFKKFFKSLITITIRKQIGQIGIQISKVLPGTQKEFNLVIKK